MTLTSYFCHSRHYEYDYNGHRIPRSNVENNECGTPLRGNLKPATSLNLLPLTRDANDESFNRKYRAGSDWNLTTSKRAFR